MNLFFSKTLFTGAVATLMLLTQACTTVENSASLTISANNPHILYSGRAEGYGTEQVVVGYSGARERIKFHGTSIGAKIIDDSGENYIAVWVDGEATGKMVLNREDHFYPLAENLEEGEHTVEVMRITECQFGLTRFEGFVLNEGAKVLPWIPEHDRKIEFIGDSITCGYGVEANDPNLHFDAATENFSLNYSGLTARALDADYVAICRSGIGIVRNYDGPYEGSKDTMPDVYPYSFYLDYNQAWDFSKYTPDVVCINLGTNDFSTTGVNVDKYIATYTAFAGKVLGHYSEAQLVIILGPMDNGAELKTALNQVVANLSENNAGRVHFLELTAQGQLGLGADYHPNLEQSRYNATELTTYLSDLMGWK
ncbi:MAG: hypothetical protein JW739_08535 [Opitutales bacterium]|nr:hypothetical protein [Opitutales bacterium]